MTTSRYAREVDLSDLDSAHTLGILLTPPGSTVLDIGVADGHPVAQGLHAQGCAVYGVEIDPVAAEAARQFCTQVVVGDVEQLDLGAAFGDRRFDVVLLLDVLEHLLDPVDTLRRAAALLSPSGKVVASIPNVTHAAVRLQLLEGNFTYTDTGLLDRTHLRFFDRAGVGELFAAAGLPVHERLRVRKPLSGTEIALDLDRLPAAAVAAATADLDADTYQFVVVAGPAGQQPLGRPDGTLLERLQQMVGEHARVTAAGGAYAHQVEQELADKQRYADSLEQLVHDSRARTAELTGELGERLEELRTVYEQLAAARADVAVKDAYIGDLVAEPPSPTDFDVVNLLGYKAVNRVVRLLRPVPGYRFLRATLRMLQRARSWRARLAGRRVTP